MRAGSTPAPSQVGSAAFELERFEWTADDRLEVTGRWFGVRGLRFMRPALDLRGDDERHRLLALLEHKPWAAEDGEPWTAAFTCDGGPVAAAEAELAVAPRITVDLPAPSVPGRRTRKRSPEPATEQSNGNRASKPPLKRARLPVSGVREKDGGERSRARAKRLRDARDAAVGERDVALRERDAAAAERDAALRERDAALTERDVARRERDVAMGERDAANERVTLARAEIDELGAARSALVAQLEAVMRERDDAIAARGAELRAYETAVIERDRMKAALDAALHERDEAAAARAEAGRQRDAALRERDAARRDRDAARSRGETPAVAPVAPRPPQPAASFEAPTEPLRAPHRRPLPASLPRAVAIGAITLLVLVVVAVLYGVL